MRIGIGLGAALSPDGRWALSLLRPFSDAVPQLLPTGAGEARQLEIEGLRLQPGAMFLPEGSGFLIAGNLEGRGKQVFQVGLEGGKPRILESTQAGDIPVQWSDDGRFIYIYTKDRLPARVDRIDIESGARDLLMELAPRDAAGVFNIDMLHMTRDGRYYVFSFRRLLTDLFIIDGLQ